MSINSSKDNWFGEWFNSPYYHLLYNYRNEEEAKSFIQRLCELEELKGNKRVLDLACGKGRHSKTLHQLGYDTSGVDLAPESIKSAKESASKEIHFEVMDMRKLSFQKHFDIVFNLFTSFGYFSDTADNQKVIQEVSSILHPKGLFCIDFLNADFVKSNLVAQEETFRTLEAREIKFNITRKIKEGFILKDIAFEDGEQSYHFQERVQFIQSHDFIRWLTEFNFEIIHTFGDYLLNPFSVEQSPRFLVVAKKK
ncbi:MAG: class I SAM-dependent methyltransferase [Flavobacteriales bacterium]|nr:class I SAM-dependent methyltransferase [Flavobacteriales bacterium]MDG1767182.1 class I SAM-dependent methyltransferase [Flavobacteriales bacterium]